MPEDVYEVYPVGWVHSELVDIAAAPMQGDEGAPDAWVVFDPRFKEALDGLEVGDRAILFTWLDRARRDILTVHPRGDIDRPEQGVFTTRAPHRPNPIGIHPVTVLAVDGVRVRVSNLEAVDGTPIVDMKPLLSPHPDAR